MVGCHIHPRGPAPATVKLKASKKVARKLRKMKSATGTVKITVVQDGKTSAYSRKLTLKR